MPTPRRSRVGGSSVARERLDAGATALLLLSVCDDLIAVEKRIRALDPPPSRRMTEWGADDDGVGGAEDDGMGGAEDDGI